MAHIERDTVNGEPRYRVRWRTTRAGKTTFHKRTFKRRKDAEVWLRDLDTSRDYNAARKPFRD
jgi:hypothetical protein